MTNTKPDFPLSTGEVVGWQGKRVTIRSFDSDRNAVCVRLAENRYRWVSIGELTSPPPIADHVQQAAEEMVAAGFLTNPHAAIFGRDES